MSATDHPLAESAADDHAALDLLIRGFEISRLIAVAADHGIADRLAPDASRHVDDLAAACKIRPQPLLRLLRALAAFRIFRVSHDGLVTHSPRSLLLRKDAAPGGLHYAARFWTGEGSWRAWGAIGEALTGGAPHLSAWSATRFEYLRTHPDEARVFDEFMAHPPEDRHRAFAEAYDFSGARLIADIGGGNGAALRRILARAPEARGLIFDRKDVIDAVPAEARLNGRIDVQAGDFFTRVPDGADIYLLNWVMHDWPDEDCVRILTSCRKAMRPDARLLIGELILDPDPEKGHPMSYLLDVHMMAMFATARERTEAEYRDLLTRAGFVFRRAIPTASMFSVIEAVPN